MELFHIAPIRLERGSIIQPGNWGRIVKAHGWNHPAAFREAILENVRTSRIPEKPSRLECVFCFKEVQDANLFLSQNLDGFRFSILYRVRVADTVCHHE